MSFGDMGTRGDRLAGFLAALSPHQKIRVIERVSSFYPLVEFETVRKRAGWINLSLSERFRNFGSIDSTQMSDGFMRILALCAIPELPNVSMVLLDEIEDGIEPHILGDLMSLIDNETHAQIVATSHSPIIANIVEPSCLRLIYRDEDGRTNGVEVDRLPSFHDNREYFGMGELWSNTSLKVLDEDVKSLNKMNTEGEDIWP